MLDRLARWCYAHRWRVLVIWIIALFGVSFLSQRFGEDLNTNFTLPSSESQRAFALLEERFPAQAGEAARVVFEAEKGIDVREVRGPMNHLFVQLERFDHVTEVTSPYEPGPAFVSPDRRIAIANVNFDRPGPELPREAVTAIKERVQETKVPGVKIEMGGQAVRFSEQEGPGGTESVGFLAAAVILLITFGSLIAMGLPILIAIFGLGTGLALIPLYGHLIDVPEFAPQLAAMIGFGVGVDYALFIVTRFRQALHAGRDPEDAVAIAITTAGRAVLFAGVTVVISLLGLFLIGLQFVQGLAIGASSTVLIAMTASVTLLPALLGFAGHAIDKLHVPFLHRDESTHRDSFWFRWSRLIQRNPLPPVLIGSALLVLLALPLFSIRLGFSDEGNDPPTSSARRAYDLVAKGFGPGFNGPFLLAAEVDDPSDLTALNTLSLDLRDVEGVAFVAPPRPSPKRDAAVIFLVPKSAPQDEASQELLHRLRATIAEKIGVDGPVVHVGGIAAAFVDMSDFLQGRLPLFITAVVVLSFLLLMVVFRSLLIPLKAALVNLLGIGAAYGTVVAIFQWGWLKDLVGIERTGPIEPFLPMMLFAILFGLSMDYEVFLMSRIREEYLRIGRNDIAVADGLAATARVITAAAAIMVTVFLAFVFLDERVVKLFGLGLAVAIFLDATVIRMVIVPGLMELLGDRNWWLPRFLERALPRISIERVPDDIDVVEHEPDEDEEPEPDEVAAPPRKTAGKKKPVRKPAPREAKPVARKPVARKPVARKKPVAAKKSAARKPAKRAPRSS